MKILTVRQPWAWAIFHAGKDIENRSWRTEVRGRIGIHSSSKVLSPQEYADIERFIQAARFDSETYVPPTDYLVHGAIIGTVELVACVKHSDSPWFMNQGYGFVLKHPRPLKKPVFCKGKMSFWDYDL